MSLLNRIWNDPVGAGVIAALIVPLLLYLGRNAALPIIKRLNFPVTWNLSGYFLGMSASGGKDIRVSGFQLSCVNKSSRHISKVSGFLRSNTTGEKLPILLDSMPPEETNGIPSKAEFQIRALFRDPAAVREGMAVEDFLRLFGDFTFVVEFDNHATECHFRREMVEANIEKFRQASSSTTKPVVSRQSAAK